MKKQTVNSSKKSITRRQAPAAWLGGCLLSLGLAWAPPTLAAEVSCGAAPDIEAAGMNCFNPNTAAKSGEVNANFKHLLDEIAALRNNNAALQARLAEVEGKLSAVSYDNNQKKLLIEGVNVQIVNGAGTTDSTNSTGNLIIGYNKDVDSVWNNICSIGDYDTQADCEAHGGTWGHNQRQGSHNLVIGDLHQYTQYGGFVAGFNNAINGKWASVSGGTRNTASGKNASVSGGKGNTASGNYASVSGGYKNKASGSLASVSGGYINTASGVEASVSGGYHNIASGEDASVSGGHLNKASGSSASVSGGYANTASKLKASISGGYENKADGQHSSILGGKDIEISDDYQTYPNP